MTARTYGRFRTRAHPPAKWNLPSWLYRMFVWDNEIPVSRSVTLEPATAIHAVRIGNFEFEFSLSGDGVKAIVKAAGIPIREFNLPFEDVKKRVKVKLNTVAEFDGYLELDFPNA